MKKLLKWLRWNSANIVSASRILAPLILFGPGNLSIREKIIAIVLWAATDFIDGPLARKIGNFNGIGKVIDAFSDKVMIFSVLWFLFQEEIISPLVAGAIILGETPASFIAVFGFYLATRKSFSSGIIKSEKTIKGKLKLIFSEAKKTILDNWKISEAGRKAMVFYLAMAIFIFLHAFFSKSLAFEYLYLIAFSGGFILRAISLRYYVSDLRRWQKKYLSET
jgi:phosphatidylglycerophosphate synthase